MISKKGRLKKNIHPNQNPMQQLQAIGLSVFKYFVLQKNRAGNIGCFLNKYGNKTNKI